MPSPRFHGRLAEAFGRQLGGELRPETLADVLTTPAESLPVPSADDRHAWSLAPGTPGSCERRTLCERAQLDLGQPWPTPLASDAVRVHRDGDRECWERSVFARQRRLSRAAIAACVTLSDRWLDEVADGAWLLCEQSSWCWPAHDDAYARNAAVLADVERPFVDLGAGEVAAQLAWIDHLLGPPLEVRYPGLLQRVRVETTRRVLAPFVARRDWHWLGLDGDVHNWSAWIHSNVLVAALVVLDGTSARRAETIAMAIEGLDRYVSALADDGACDEGAAYWWEGACRALEACEVLRHATAGRLDALAAVPALRATIGFPHRMHLGGPWYVNVADGRARELSDRPWRAVHHAALAAGDTEAVEHAAAHRRRGGHGEPEGLGLGRLARALTDEPWLTAGPAHPPFPRDTWLASTQMLVARERGGTRRGLAVAVKGGNNGEHHNHNDVGSFIVASDGVPAVVDAGRPTYTALTFGPDRYSIWTMQSSWHNVPEIRSTAQSPGRDRAAREVAVDISDTAAELALDLALAYPVDELRRWHRRVRLERGPTRPPRVEIEDRWILDRWPCGDEPATTIRLLLAGDVEQHRHGVDVIPVDGAPPVRLTWAVVASTITIHPLDDPMLVDVWGEQLTRIDLDVTGRNRFVVVVTNATSSGALT